MTNAELQSVDGDTRTPAIYVASLADYNAGRLHGVWLSADQEPRDLAAQTAAMLRSSREPVAEEWAIHDHDNFMGLEVDEHASFASVARLVIGIRRYGRPYVLFADWVGVDYASHGGFERSYAGCFADPDDYLTELFALDALSADLDRVVPPSLRGYVTVDTAGLLRDLRLNGEIYTVASDEGLHVFEAGDLGDEDVVNSTSDISDA